MLTDTVKSQLVRLAFQAQRKSYSPYSRFRVGAALLTTDGQIFQGANIENASYGAAICAERVAVVQAAFAGVREIIAVAVVAAPKGGEFVEAYPCGICRQVLREFLPSSGDMVVLIATTPDDYIETSLNALLPHSFGPSDLDYLME